MLLKQIDNIYFIHILLLKKFFYYCLSKHDQLFRFIIDLFITIFNLTYIF